MMLLRQSTTVPKTSKANARGRFNSVILQRMSQHDQSVRTATYAVR
jgi:hypothetical protein